ANIAVIMNITPDHLDRYDYKFENYVKAKFRILQNQTPTDAFIYWHDDPVIKAQLEKISVVARQYPFAEHEGDNVAAYVDPDDQLVINTSGTSLTMPRADLALNGLHNLFNSMAAGLSASVLNIAKEDIRRALSDFEGVEHRLEYVDTVNGVRYINDSKATNVNSCWYALESMPRNVVLILGGKDKGNDYSEILPLVKEKVKAIVAMGKDNTKIVDYFGSTVKVVDTHSIDEAIDSCAAIAVEGDTVLLSPCCASFDLFKSYEHRGKLFKEQVARLKAGK
ncbi:MAG: UDP-N-acetylmuramoyl-L-alanine--D-glutamate ligase, partial [Muribaculaceae bacterium]|nr:UDP-N-acetylmuramoyl-L-alanine--D-glutamate ligase [Muribaculaceae bacterium]